ncbi:MAG: 1-acyl-sn-glycerol-3-phosphate acyltransferase [Saprospiraceae bacterium]|nr:1-acyl-sn-glycerol-3-phosphate acyltransferase [Saprospiraceae bacterium]
MKYPILNSIISGPVYFLLYTFTALVVLFTLLLATLNLRKALRIVLNFWASSLFFISGKKIRLEGKENLVMNKKYILLANHSSLFDIPAIMSIIPDVTWFGKEYLTKIPIFGKALRMTGYIPMRTAIVKNTKVMLKQLVEKSDAGSIAIFPEGTRTEDGKLLKFHRGFIYLMRASELDILPVTLNGFYKLKPKTRTTIDFSSKISIIIHKPIDFQYLEPKNDEEILNEIRSVISSKYAN